MKTLCGAILCVISVWLMGTTLLTAKMQFDFGKMDGFSGLLGVIALELLILALGLYLLKAGKRKAESLARQSPPPPPAPSSTTSHTVEKRE